MHYSGTTNEEASRVTTTTTEALILGDAKISCAVKQILSSVVREIRWGLESQIILICDSFYPAAAKAIWWLYSTDSFMINYFPRKNSCVQ